MNIFYKAGYYLIKQKPVSSGSNKGKLIATCSGCINLSVFDSWCFGWMQCELSAEDKEALSLSEEKITEIRNWTDQNFSHAANIFFDVSMAIEFKNLFFQNQNDIKIYSVSFPETDANLLMEEFAFGKNTTTFNFNNSYFALRENLLKKVKDINFRGDTILGYDLIGVECDGSFHSFYCQNITDDLINKFNLKLNSNGLFALIKNPEVIRQYLNGGFVHSGPLPWYIARVKQIDSQLIKCF